MRKFIIEEKFVGYANIIIEANTDDEALSLYKKSDISDISKFSIYFTHYRVVIVFK